jgi:sterol desaturase/sphingolipid hydroxylase (fatty acid hydroxylase superfamily)
MGLALLVSLATLFAMIWSVAPERAREVWESVVGRLTTTSGWKPWLYFALLAGVLAVEAAVLGWSRSSIHLLLRGSRSARADLVVAGLHAIGWSALLMTAFTGGALYLLQDLAVPFQSVRLSSLIAPVWLQVLVVFVLIDFLDYWYHRISHEIEFLWEAHKYHHAAVEFTVLTGNRIHALEEAFRHVFVLIPMAALGTPAEMYIGVRYGILAFDMLQHSMVPWTYGWFGRWVVFSPVGHRIHHSPLTEHWDRNYGNLLVIWDRLFGTWYGGERVNSAVDVSENPYNRRSVIVEYLLCGAWYFRSLYRSLNTGRWRTEHQLALRSGQDLPKDGKVGRRGLSS